MAQNNMTARYDEQTLLLEEWLHELRTTTEKQGRYSLARIKKDGIEYCALGLAGKKLGHLTRLDSTIDPGDGVEYLYWGQYRARAPYKFISDLPDDMWGFCTPVVNYKGKDWCVSLLNDVIRLSFREIADLIEATARELGWLPTKERTNGQKA